MDPCQWCGGKHEAETPCPRVRSFAFHPDGSLAGVEFWEEPDGSGGVGAWLEGIDPGMLDAAVVELIGVEGETFGEVAVVVLKKWAASGN